MSVTRFTNGLTTVTKSAPLGQFGLPDVTGWHTYFNDFDTYIAGDWTITSTGTPTEALTDADGGVLLVTNTAADDDADFFNKVGESFLFETNKKLFFKTRFKVSDATQSDIVMGLQITDTTPLDVTDGVFFQKDDGDANIDFHVEKDNTATTASTVGTLADDTYIELAFFYNGKGTTNEGTVAYFVDGVKQGSSVVTNLPDDEELTVSFGVQNGEAVAKTMSMDYIFVAKQR